MYTSIVGFKCVFEHPVPMAQDQIGDVLLTYTFYISIFFTVYKLL